MGIQRTRSQVPHRGFTLVELLVVIAIIGILASIGLQAFSGSQNRARDAKRKTDLHQITDYLLTDYLEHASIFPIADPGISSGPSRGPIWLGATDTDLRTQADAIGFVIPSSPNDATAAAPTEYWYVSDPQGTVFAFFVKLEAGSHAWFVINSRGHSDEIKGSDTVDVLPESSNTECVSDPSGSVIFSPCAGAPIITSS